MSTALPSFNLTQYTSLRALQFEHSKLQDQNLQLTAKISTLETHHQQLLIKHRHLQEQTTAQHQKLKKSIEEKQQEIEAVGSWVAHKQKELHQFQKIGIDLEYTPQATDNTVSALDQIWRVFITAMTRYNQQGTQFERQVQMFRNDNRVARKVQHELREELDYLSDELAQLQKINISINNELNLVRRQNHDLKLRVYSFDRQTQKEDSCLQNQAIQDNNFTVDLLHYQKELLQRTFQKVLSAIDNDSISSILTDIYSAYQKVSDVYREKLQIQYDLEDLQREYKKEKHSKVGQKLLIELRKQIEQFRNELQTQKQLISREQTKLEEEFLMLRAADKEQKHVRTFAVDMQKQLQTLRSQALTIPKEEKPNTETKRDSWESRAKESSRIRFKASQSNEDVIKEVVKQDRENMERMFKETRRTYLKQHS